MSARVLPAVALLLSLLATSPAPAQSRVQSGYVQVRNGTLYYEVAGRGTPVILIHGGFGDRRMWDAQFEDLARDHRVVRYDHRGFGKSRGADSAYSPVHDLELLMNHLDIDRAHLIGNSAGGGFAIDFAVLQPKRVNKLVVVASGANGYPWKPEDYAETAKVFAIARESVDSAAGLWLQHPMIAVASKDPRTSGLVTRMVMDNRNMFLINWPTEKMSPRSYDRLNELKVPTLFVLGEKDMPIVLRVAEATAARIPGAQIFRMPNADHLPQMVEPDAFNKRIREFFHD